MVTSDRRFLWCGGQICEERDAIGSSVIRRFYRQGMQEGTTPFFYSNEHLGSVREMTDSTGTVRARYDYDPFGRRTLITGDKETPFGFTGHYSHSPTGLTLAMFRAYEPALGRWITEDPVGLRGGLNLYSYVDNNSVNYIDPAGRLKVAPGVPVPTGDLYINLKCLEECIGSDYELRITATTNDHPPGTPHGRGVAADFTIGPRDPFHDPTKRPPIHAPVSHKWVLCCARACSFRFSQYETGDTPGSTGVHFHVQIPPGQGGAIRPRQEDCYFDDQCPGSNQP